MKKLSTILLIICLFVSCTKELQNKVEKPFLKKTVEDDSFVIDSSFIKGDSRRYGVCPNKPINPELLKKLIILAEKGQAIYFSKGYYNTNIQLKGVSDIQFNFDNVIVTGLINIMEKADTVYSNRIEFKGNLTILDKLFIRKSKNISFDTLNVVTDIILNISHMKNRGVSIYTKSKNISFKNLIIKNTGGKNINYYSLTTASLQIHAYHDSPEKVIINNLEINNSARSAFYLTGKEHLIRKVKITNFGLRKNQDKDTNKLKIKKPIVGFWIDKCSFCEIDSLFIDNRLINKDIYSLFLDMGISSQPSFINNLSLKNSAKTMPIKDNKSTNILVKNEF